jgi:hypothetical protein
MIKKNNHISMSVEEEDEEINNFPRIKNPLSIPDYHTQERKKTAYNYRDDEANLDVSDPDEDDD